MADDMTRKHIADAVGNRCQGFGGLIGNMIQET
jgi:hypothetical protein